MTQEAGFTLNNANGNGFRFQSAATTQLTLDSSGNLGLGVTPVASLAGYKTFQIASQGVISSDSTSNGELEINNNAYRAPSTATPTYINSFAATKYAQYRGEHRWFNAPSGTAGNAITFTQAMTLDASGNLGIGTTSPTTKLSITDSAGPIIRMVRTSNRFEVSADTDFMSLNARDASTYITFKTADTERARIDSSGILMVGKTSPNVSSNGVEMGPNGYVSASRNNDIPMFVNRNGNDGTLVDLAQAGTSEGTISVSGTTVSYNGGHLSRWAQMLTKPELFKGTVMSNLDEMNVYTKDGQPVANEQLNKVKVSDTEGDVNVAGVFVNWSHDEQHNVDEINMAMTGDMIIRIAQGVTVVRGDLLMSAGDGTAKPQGDDIVRSKTVAKVTSNHVTCTYADGSYCVPCVLMAC